MRLGDPIFWQMHVHDAASLEHQLPHQCVGNSLIKVADVDRGLFILFPEDVI